MAHDVQLEIEVDNLAQLEAFWGQIPSQAHKAWGQRAQVQHSCHHPQSGALQQLYLAVKHQDVFLIYHA